MVGVDFFMCTSGKSADTPWPKIYYSDTYVTNKRKKGVWHESGKDHFYRWWAPNDFFGFFICAANRVSDPLIRLFSFCDDWDNFNRYSLLI